MPIEMKISSKKYSGCIHVVEVACLNYGSTVVASAARRNFNWTHNLSSSFVLFT